MTKVRYKRIPALILCLLLAAAWLLPLQTARAAGETAAITMLCPVDGMVYKAYRVGEGDGEEGFTLNEPYASYGVDLSNTAGAAATLADYVTRDGLQPDYTQACSQQADGLTAVFTGLPQGVYLMVCDSIEVDGWQYRFLPSLLELPQLRNGELVWEITAETKHERSNERTEISVIKLWDDEDSASRPTEITVQLLQNGKVTDAVPNAEVILSAENNWTYVWVQLPAGCEWTVVEKAVPDGYSISKQQEGAFVSLTNTLNPPEEPPETPPEQPPENPPSENPPDIPYTGQNWMPVMILLPAGLCFVLVGLLVRTGKKHR